MIKEFLKHLIRPNSVVVGKGGKGEKIRLIKLKPEKYESLVKQGIADMKVIKETSDYVMLSVSSNSYDEKLIRYHKLD